MADRRNTPRITVLAGTNGAGKSSIAGEALVQSGGVFFNPDEAAARLRAANPTLSQEELNSLAWTMGKSLLERAIARKNDYAFETTLGGNTIPSLLERAADSGLELAIWYVGLATPELHISRVKVRVARGGHDIPEDKIRDRYSRSVFNLIRLMPRVSELLVYDNSLEADPWEGVSPEPLLVLHARRGKIIRNCDPAHTPQWAKPIVITALKMAASRE